jgi:hypothetical protein
MSSLYLSSCSTSRSNGGCGLNVFSALLERLNIRPPATVLEAGCGWGTNLKALEAKGYQITGLDVSRKMLDRLDRRLVEADLTQGLPDRLPTYDCRSPRKRGPYSMRIHKYEIAVLCRSHAIAPLCVSRVRVGHRPGYLRGDQT